ncbi:MAG: DEAD/DEAH box helicase [Deltaproteobacteria bacterium]|nr:DEAD/DEAH box helicase [Deltaproteobacteria bacterium]
MTFAVGSLVRARGREWVVLPESGDAVLVVRPLGGTEDEVAGLYLPVEPVAPATFDLPDPARLGDFLSSRMLRDAVRLGFRSSAGPFRSFARLGVDPRPYQLVPLMLALKLDPVRLLIADDVGIGKTIEASLIARELLDRGEIDRLAVLCPPHLAEQWQAELSSKFHIEAELVLPGTATRLERQCRQNESVFDRFPFVIVSTDFIKSDRRRDDFVRACPEFVIVDEAHACVSGGTASGGRHQRHALLRKLAERADRHVVLVTATPHSGNEDAFRALLALLDPTFADLPDDLTGARNAPHRRRLAAHLVQRRRGDITKFLDDETPFPKRQELEESYTLTPEYRRLFDKVLAYARETVRNAEGGAHRQRIRWWSAIALLRSMASSPVAAAVTLGNRAASAETDTVEEADEVGRRAVLDLGDDDATDVVDVAPGSENATTDAESKNERRRLREFAREADALAGKKDAKLQRAIALVKQMVGDGFNPIVFCRFIPTAEYVAAELASALKGVTVDAVTGNLPHDERETRVAALGTAAKRVLVATDCLSEGINLQDHFNAVVHYDLSWNPTRHEQREGRVDRYGQAESTIRVLSFYGKDNRIDGIVLDVLLRKHKVIRSSLGIAVPVPGNSNDVVEAILDGLLTRGDTGAAEQLVLGDILEPAQRSLHAEWDAAADREKTSRTMFAQESLKPEEVRAELEAVRAAIGSRVDVERFVRTALGAHGAVVSASLPAKVDVTTIDARHRGLRDAIDRVSGGLDRFAAAFELPVRDGVLHLGRTHPVVEALAAHVMDAALDPIADAVARRCGVIRTSGVAKRTTALLVRFRFHIVEQTGETERPLLAEDSRLMAFRGAPAAAEWLENAAAEDLLAFEPTANIAADQAREALRRVLDGFDALRPALDAAARKRGDELLEAHRRVRTAAKRTGVRYRVEPQLPPDVLGVYLFLPGGA